MIVERYRGHPVKVVRTVLCVCLATLVAACAATAPYRPATGGGEGYQSRRLGDNLYSVAYRLEDRPGAADTLGDYLLYRCAELAVEKGYSWFAVVEERTSLAEAGSRLAGRAAMPDEPDSASPRQPTDQMYHPGPDTRVFPRLMQIVEYMVRLSDTRPDFPDSEVYKAKKVLRELEGRVPANR
ncbi:MAG: CC0125/CC1285 family lipoprotein [Desulfatibacillaceae bacterium]